MGRCSFYNIQEGTIEFACDGLSALNRAFSHVSLLSVAEPSYDMLVAIRRQWVHSTILWEIRHVEGHQDDKRSVDLLDRWGKLNVEMDMAAKQYIATAKQRPRHYLLKHDPWSLWYNNHKLVKNVKETLYNIVHSVEARVYWTDKEKIENQCFDYLNWDAIGLAMKSQGRPKCLFISKQTVGMCGVGKFMKIWKQRDSDKCPRCEASEDAAHVLTCSGAGADAVWDNSLKNLEEWMIVNQTDPDIQEAILKSLHKWRTDDVDSLPIHESIRVAMDQQNDIGWQALLEGWAAMEWEFVQQDYYSLIASRRTGK